MNNVLNKVVLEILKEFRGNRSRDSNEPRDLFKGIPLEYVHSDYIFDSYVDDEGEAVTSVFYRNNDGSKGSFIKTVKSELLRIEDNKMHTGFETKSKNSIK